MAKRPSPESNPANPSPAAKPNGNADSSVSRKSLGKYQMIREIGAGGMGVVYLAKDTQLNRTVALKILGRDKRSNPTLVRRFQAEALAAAQLRHENIVLIYDSGEIDGLPFIALEYVEGTDVHNLVGRRGPLPIPRSVDIIKQVARALDHAYQKGIVHRDIKPSNLLVSRDGKVKLADMGLARSIDESTETGITRAGTTVGTVDYMAPEQARDSKAADVRSDIYSLGCTWYHMLTGAPPFSTGSLTSKLYAHAAKNRPDPRDTNKDVPEGVVAVMHRMLERKPKDRYQTPAELLDALDHVDFISDTAAPQYLAALSDAVAVDGQDETPAAAAPAHQPPPTPPPRRRTRQEQPSAPSGVNAEVFKYAGIGVAAAAVFGLLWWIATQFAAGLDSPGTDANPFVGAGQAAPEQAPMAPSEEVQVSTPKPETKKASPPEKKSEPPVAVVNARRATNTLNIVKAAADAEAFKSTLGRRGEKEYVPQWTAAEWALANAPPAALRTKLTVGRAEGGPAQFSDLQTALESLAAPGGVIVLAGEGPFFVSPIELQGKQVVITAADNSNPVVVFSPDAGSEQILSVSNGSLVFDHVHLAALSSQFPASGEMPTLVGVDSGDLVVRNCSLTLVGKFPGPVTACRVSGAIPAQGRAPADQSNILLDGVLARGNGLCVLDVDQPATDLLASNCLFVTGSQPAVRLSNSVPVKAAGTGAKRRLQFLSCTLLAEATALEFQPGVTVSSPPATAILTLNSIFAAAPGSAGAALLSLGQWPVGGSVSEPTSKNISWETASSLFVGWGVYVCGDALSAQKIQSAASWQQFWNRGADASEQFNSTYAWPGTSADDPAQVESKQFQRPAAPSTGVNATDGGDPGCDVAVLPVRGGWMSERAAAFAARPDPPIELLTDAPATQTEEIDLTKTDLGKHLSKPDWASGTRFVASGSGNQTSSPIRISGKTIYLRIQPSNGTPLQISPQPAASAADGGDSAFIVVDGGTLVIEGGNFAIPAGRRQPLARRFLRVVDGSFALRGTTIEGPMRASSGFDGLIAWERRDATPPEGAGSFEHFALIEDSYLAGDGTLLDLALRGQAIRIENSVLVSLKNLCNVNIPGSDQKIAGSLDVFGSTLSAAEQFFHLRSDLTEAATDPLQVFIEQTAFAPPVAADASRVPQPVLADCPDSMRETKQVAWWDADNGYAREVSRLSPSSEPSLSSAELAEQWKQIWGSGHVQRPIFGGVLLKGTLPAVARVNSGDFELDRSSQAVSWTVTGGRIGAELTSQSETTTRSAPAPRKAESGSSSPRKKKPRKPTAF